MTALSLKNVDKFARKFSDSINELVKYEVQSSNHATHLHRQALIESHKRLFDSMRHALFKRRRYAQDQDLWVELYKRSLYFYPLQNDIEGIPCTMVTKHNGILSFYMKHRIDRSQASILRFDTHADLNPVRSSSKLPLLHKLYIQSGDVKYVDEAQEMVWDIGAAKSGVLFTTGIKDVIWGMPSWVPDKSVTIDYFIKIGKKNLTLATPAQVDDIGGLDEWTHIKKNRSHDAVRQFTRLQTGRLTKKGLRTLTEQVEKNGLRYILDIDLDYFICNGKPFTKSYWKDSYDLQSFKRTEYIDYNQNLPRSKFDETSQMNKYDYKLHLEVLEVNRRIKKFLKLIAHLKRKGMIPEYISVCDSTNILFSQCKECNSLTNGYVPGNLALWVHHQVVSGLERVLKPNV